MCSTAVNPPHPQLGLPQSVPLLDVAACLVQIVWRQVQGCVIHVRVVVLYSDKSIVSVGHHKALQSSNVRYAAKLFPPHKADRAYHISGHKRTHYTCDQLALFAKTHSMNRAGCEKHISCKPVRKESRKVESGSSSARQKYLDKSSKSAGATGNLQHLGVVTLGQPAP